MGATVQDPFVGRLVDGRYDVESRIARGGMATVYLARDRRLDREVALKILHDHLAEDPQFAARFVREARAAARLSHPHVVAVYDQGSEDGVLYLAMEHLRGRTLRQALVDRGALTPREALAVLDPLLDALSAAHAAGIVHRDVKPENVILLDNGGVKVADFGLARAATAATSTGVLLGTVAYLSPELITRGIADARSDVYAAGVLAFEMLTGRQPFTGDLAVQIAFQHVHDTVPLVSEVVPGLPEELDALVCSATAQDPDDRPRDAAEMLQAVRRVRAALPADVLDHRPAVATPAVAVAGLAAATAVAGPLAPGAPQPVAAAVPEAPTTVVQSLPEALPQHTQALDDAAWMMRRRRRRGLLAAVVVLALALAGGTAGWWFASGPGAYTTAPRVVGSSVDAALTALARQHLQGRTDETYVDGADVGEVVGSDPAPGTRLKRGTAVVLTVAKGPLHVAVPKVAGQGRASAEKEIEGAGLRVGDATSTYDDDVAKGRIVRTDPEPGQKLRRGSAVALVLSKGPEPVAVPSVVGKEKADAVAALDHAGLKVSAGEATSESVPAGRVVSQDPASGKVPPGTTVKLVVSKGPPLVEVPDVSDQRFKDAKKALQEKGFKVRRVGTGFIDRVFQQSPGAHQLAPKGSTVTLRTI